MGIARKDGRQWLPKAADAGLYRAAYPQRGPRAFVAVRSDARIGLRRDSCRIIHVEERGRHLHLAVGALGMKKASPVSQQAADCRALAERARRLAGTLLDGPDKDELLRYAKELETRASGLEDKGARPG